MRFYIVGERINLAQRVQFTRQITVDVMNVDKKLAVDVQIPLLPAAGNLPHGRQLFTERLALRARRMNIELDQRHAVFPQNFLHRHSL